MVFTWRLNKTAVVNQLKDKRLFNVKKAATPKGRQLLNEIQYFLKKPKYLQYIFSHFYVLKKGFFNYSV